MVMELDKIIEEVESLHPYKISGKPDTYSQYNEGFSDACDILGERVKKLIQSLKEREREILQLNEHWTTADVLEKLIEASEILLHDKDYDGHGWEKIEHCVERGKEINKVLKNRN